jgi:hypothetical protein
MNEEAEQVWNQGEYVMSIDYYGYRINLYLVGKEYYEVFYNPSSNEIEKINRADKDDMDKYASRIQLNRLQ